MPLYRGSRRLAMTRRVPAIITGASYAYRGFNNSTSATQSFSMNLGPAVTARVIAVLNGQGANTITSLTVNGTSLTPRVADNTVDTVIILDGLVSVAGTGTDAVVVNWSVGSAFDRNCHLFTATGLTTGYISGATQAPGPPFGPSLSVQAGDFLFAVERGSTSSAWTSSTQSPTATHSDGTAGTSADWTIVSTNAAFAVIPQFGGVQNVAAANYR